MKAFLFALFASASAVGVDIFSSHTEGYFCFKIPDLITTSSGTLLAFAEARIDSCSDYAETHLVVSRSEDLGATWSNLSVVHSEADTVIGNGAPVQVSATGRILLPFTRNNAEVWATHSDDDGITWASPRNISDTGMQPNWLWVGTGPPGGIELASGRIVIPGYHTTLIHGDGGISKGHVMISDDAGDTWYVAGIWGEGTHYLPNENQVVEIAPDVLFANARAVFPYRLGAYSYDGGLTFGDTFVLENLPAPLDGCEGSTIVHPETGLLLYTGPSKSPTPWRSHIALFTSADNGTSWDMHHVIDNGPSAYSALTIMSNGSVAVLYEREDEPELVFNPTAISFLPLNIY